MEFEAPLPEDMAKLAPTVYEVPWGNDF